MNQWLVLGVIAPIVLLFNYSMYKATRINPLSVKGKSRYGLVMGYIGIFILTLIHILGLR